MGTVFLTGELVTPATFFFLPFAIGAGVASLLCFFNLSVGVSWVAFIVVSIVMFAGLWRIGRRLEQSDVEQESVGATRWVGQEALVEADIEANGYGTVRLEREIWRAESLTGTAIKKGSTVVITKLAGTRLIVVPLDEPDELTNYPEINPGGSNSESTQGAN